MRSFSLCLLLLALVLPARAGDTTVTTFTLTANGGSTSLQVTVLPDDGTGVQKAAITGNIEGFGPYSQIGVCQPTGDGSVKCVTTQSNTGDGDGAGILPHSWKKSATVKVNADPADGDDGDPNDDPGGEVDLSGGPPLGRGGIDLHL